MRETGVTVRDDRDTRERDEKFPCMNVRERRDGETRQGDEKEIEERFERDMRKM